ncbi:SDR family NAD(P)-dependent oxidoreductase [Chitinophaga varians]|uniref:SDR family NAD(P)-dependent oxidoreductase n=1 Tax=Chitinophaga varians TaxID=2202339 RepID=UPI00165F91D3|nr:SDR family NAD(P)-dependent oxidoreductase [Chitinophaga varians]MBC9915290.1 SDR family NAD(P)-dependent oxidoreductase [Chitinophaga varians]
MIDFIEYVVAELKHKRLSKADALDLIRQFSLRTATQGHTDIIHPLLHTNTSDLTRQRFAAVFNGEEFFLKDHQIGERRLLPATAYLEMARVAFRKAMPVAEESVIELRNVIWAQPVVVDDAKEVSITLSAGENDSDELEVFYEVCSAAVEGEDEMVHCQGQAAFLSKSASVKLDIDRLKEQLHGARLEGSAIYNIYARYGLHYGPSFRGIKTIFQGDGQLLAELSLPVTADSPYVLHPGMMDSTLQAAIGLFSDLHQLPDQVSLPFALDTLRVFTACAGEMRAWVRYADNKGAHDKVIRLDIDLCHPDGTVAVQMRGFSSRIADTVVSGELHQPSRHILHAAPVWQAVTGTTDTGRYEQEYLFLCALPAVNAEALQSLLPQIRIVTLKAAQEGSMAARFSSYAVACFEQIKDILAGKPQGNIRVRIITPADREQLVLTALSGLIKTAAIENPFLTGQLITVDPTISAPGLLSLMQENQAVAPVEIIRYEQGVRQVLRWEELPAQQSSPMAFKDNGVYLITGGGGMLGGLFAKEILQQTSHARVMLTGRAALTARQQAAMQDIPNSTDRLFYRQLDVTNLDEVQETINTIIKTLGQLNGILHSAGMTADNFMLRKTTEAFSQVLSPKVTGTCNLDEASKNIDLDFLVLFSSIAAVTGNNGQADYATANAFMDHFAAYRQQLMTAGLRQGKTVAINWPLWEEGGMKPDVASLEVIRQQTGMHPMQTTTGLQAFYRSLQAPQHQLLVAEGDLHLLQQTLLMKAVPATAVTEEVCPVADMDAESLEEKTRDYIKKQLAELFRFPAHKIDPHAPLEKYGIDSILAVSLTNQLEQTFGALPKTLFFEYQTIAALTAYFIKSHAARLTALFTGSSGNKPKAAVATPPRVQQPSPAVIKRRRQTGVVTDSKKQTAAEPVAIVGLSGRYPGAVNIEAYWNNLRDGKDSITEVPADRWNWKEYYSQDRSKSGHHYSKWGGFIDGVDEFDPLFFNISPLEAEILDPQERLFLQHAWMAVEDAGYTRSTLQVPHDLGLPGQVGVYAGVMYSEYQLFGAEAAKNGQRMGVPGSYASIANRVSYILNLHGPSMTIDSMCSSSLTAIHLACQDLREGRTSMGIAGGVNVSIHPNKYLVISAGQYISGDGHCQSFGEGGEGYIPGEGVGVVVLKRLSDAVRDGDHIYGVIKGSALNHGGKTNGYSVPNPQAQSNLISHVLRATNTDPRHVSYIEAHGTGTRLGDPIEIAALSQAFQRHTSDAGFCLIGSAKSNIGHCESAAGIAGLTKVLLQLKHRQIVPSLHSSRLNPHIDFEQTPFVVNQTLRAWEQPVVDGVPQPRLAGISSFGAGGSNAHMIIQEYIAPAMISQPVDFADPDDKVIIPLSARTHDQLKQKAQDLADFLQPAAGTQEKTREAADLHAMAYTLQTGREAMDIRAGFLVSSVEDLLEKLRAFVRGEEHIDDVYHGHSGQEKDTLSLFHADTAFEQTVDKWIAQKKLSKLLDLWTRGLHLDWRRCYDNYQPRRISLPPYPFAKDRYWIDIATKAPGNRPAIAATVIHPMLHSNTSDLERQRYSAVFSGEEFFLEDHQIMINGAASKVLPAVAYLEMARTAIENATPGRQGAGVLELRHTAWLQPLIVTGPLQVDIVLQVKDNDAIDFEISSTNGDEVTVHCEGTAAFVHHPAPSQLDIAQLKGRMEQGSMAGERLYGLFAPMGLAYGPAFQGVTAVHRGEGQLLAQLHLPATTTDQHQFILHPGLMDSALQAAFGLADNLGALPSSPSIPFALDSLRILSATTAEMFAWIRTAKDATGAVVRLDIDLCNEQGNVCVQWRGLASRQLNATSHQDIHTLIAGPVWEAEVPTASQTTSFQQRHVFLCEMPAISAGHLETLISDSRCIQPEVTQQPIAARYSTYALHCFELVREIMKTQPAGDILVQVVMTTGQEQALLAGLSGLLRTAAQENPRLRGQLVLVARDIDTVGLAARLKQAAAGPAAVVRYEKDQPYVLRWQEAPASSEDTKPVFRDKGVYLITGGLGALGLLFTQEILQRTKDATIILTGRAAMTAAIQAVINGLPAHPGQIVYHPLDLTDMDQVQSLMNDIKNKYKQVHGIIHSAGMVSDNFILKKTTEEFSAVLAPKVAGTYHLDEASKDIDLDFFVLFSSLSGVMGNPGQADYAAANAFMDAFAAYRQQLTLQQQRKGRTLSISWPLWADGHMRIDQHNLEMLRQATGIMPMQTTSGIQAFYRSMAQESSHVLVMEGESRKMRHILFPQQQKATTPVPVAAPVHQATSGLSEDKTIAFLRTQFAGVLKLPVQELDPKAPLENYGIDSILAMKLTSMLETTFGVLSRTLFFEYQTIKSLAAFLVKAYPHIIREKIDTGQTITVSAAPVPEGPGQQPLTTAVRRRFRQEAAAPREVAIIGMSGKYPMADNLEEFWDNLKNGRDCITEIPADRWDADRFFDARRNQAGKSYSKWGGFVKDVDKFDPLFFNISPKEAELTDPQERLFLETVWQTFEDAGYSKAAIAGLGRVGVYVGVMYGQYQLYGAEAMLAGNMVVPGSSYASIANRISYFFDLHGPSIALDTMCSSSLTAIHQACEEIRKGEIDAAIAGGVNVSIHPHKYLLLSQGNFAASDGKCRSFGEGGDGYVAGEGVGAILLKSLDKAIEDGDQIYGVIKSSAINHGGKTNGYSVPNPHAQGDLILTSLKKARIDPATLSYLETHGTGTALGDPIEITGLISAFGAAATQAQFCPIGSVKSNIGHLESAAGIASVTKVLLQLRHKKLVPSLHAAVLNSHIDFNQSPFYVQRELAAWERPTAYPRRAGISSFGAGGANAHLIIEEHVRNEAHENTAPLPVPRLFVLSARNAAQLQQYATRMVTFLDNHQDMSLAAMAYTLQVGRTPMQERLAVMAATAEELLTKLQQWISRQEKNINATEGIWHGNTKDAPADTRALLEGEEGRAFLDVVMATGNLEKLAKLWLAGADIDWSLLWQLGRPQRMSLPTYPFAKERYWVSTPIVTMPSAAPLAAEQKQSLYYSPEWVEEDLPVSPAAIPTAGITLVLDTSGELCNELSTQYTGEHTFILVKPGAVYEETTPAVFTIDPQQETHFQQLAAYLAASGQLPVRVIHHANAYNEEDTAQQLLHGVYTLFNLCKAFMAQPQRMALRIVSFFAGTQTVPLHTALGGFFKTLALENPHYRAKVVAVQTEGEIAVADKARIILEECRQDNWQQQEIRYQYHQQGRRSQRWVSRLTELHHHQHNTDNLPFKQNGVYIISGGLGGLGLIISEYLVKNYQCKLVLFGRSALNAALEEKITRLQSGGSTVLYLQADVSQQEDMMAVVAAAREQFGQINGVIHSAGINRDAFILRKQPEEMTQVLAPKIDGAVNLDLATKDEQLDLFILFSSMAGVTGNAGQCDYAYANHFMDAFATQRAALVEAQQRCGRTLSVNWPYWQDGGMHIPDADVALMEKQTGICPMPTVAGMQCLEVLLQANVLQGLPLYGFPSAIRAAFSQHAALPEKSRQSPASTEDTDSLYEQTENYLRILIGKEIKLDPERIDPAEKLEAFGIDSIAISSINTSLERDLGPLPKTLLYEYPGIAELAMYLVREETAALRRLLQVPSPVKDTVAAVTVTPIPASVAATATPAVKDDEAPEPIAIIGIHGSFPQSEDLHQYWENLKQGKSLTDLVPADRWNWEESYDADPGQAAAGKIYCKWGGFISDADKFDPEFFHITPEEARIMDPQERLFLQSVWTAIEDAGYTRDSLKKKHPKGKSADVGVFVGVTTNTYNLLAAESWRKGQSVPSAHPWSIANRVSYLFDFNGPSMPVDTACSSSSVAIHLACESLRKQECQVAVAGGVNLYLHPSKYHSLCRSRMVARSGKCHSYGAGDDGFVPGEAVGAVLLKPLSKAIADNDHIYGVLTGSAFDHSGRSNGYSAPNPNAQANLIEHTLRKAGVHPETISYVEGHGTGTQLGDSLEIVALTNVFRQQTQQKQFSSIGSVKANIGHPESAAGIAGVAKVLLQLKHRQLAPTIHSNEVNPNIAFADSPFYLQHRLAPWEPAQGHPRRALINSFGAGGVNACLLLEEYQAVNNHDNGAQGPHLIVLSAKNTERLQECVNRLLAFVGKEKQVDLSDLSFTLQAGREAMPERLALVVADRAMLISRLKAWRQHKSTENLYQGQADPRQGRKLTADKQAEIIAYFGSGNLDQLAQLWVAGVAIDWESLYTGKKPRRMSLPTYPFMKERYWADQEIMTVKPVQEPPSTQLHPLVSYNSSTLREVSFSSWLSDNAFYAVDHQVNGEKIFPGSGFIEIASICGSLAGEKKVSSIRDIVWVSPLSFSKGPQFIQTFLKPGSSGTAFSITSFDGHNESVVHSEGKLFFRNGSSHAKKAERIAIQQLKAQCPAPQDGAHYYRLFHQAGFQYGAAFKTIREFYVSDSFALSRLQLADPLKAEADRFMLHPCLVDGALQTVAGLVSNMESDVPYVPFAIDEIEIFRSLPSTCYAYVEHADTQGSVHADIKKFNIKIISEGGDVLASIKNFYVRAFARMDKVQDVLLQDQYLIK